MALSFLSRGFGAWANGIRVSVVASAEDETLPLSFTGGGDPNGYIPLTVNVSLPQDRASYSYLIRAGILIACTDNLGEINISHADQIVAISGTAGDLGEVSFESAPTLRDLASWINLLPGFSATVIGQAWLPVTVLNDTGGIVSCYDSNGDLFFPAEEGLAEYLLNSQCPLVTAAVGGYPGTMEPLAEVSLESGAGRSTDAMTDSDLIPALAIAATGDYQGIFIQSADFELQQLALQHCTDMSSVDERKYRIFFAGINFTGTSPVDGADGNGATTDLAIADSVQRARNLDGLCVLAFNGTASPNPLTGISEQLGGLGLAAQAIGMWAGARVSMPLTNKPVVSTSLEFAPFTRGQQETLLDAGVFFPQYSARDGRTKIVQAITTYQTDNPAFRNLQGMSIQQHINRMWVRVLEKYIGTTLDLENGERLKTDCAQSLDDSILSGNNPDGFLTRGRLADGTSLSAWEDLTVTGDSTLGLWDIQVNAHAVGETDYIRVRTRLSPVPIEL